MGNKVSRKNLQMDPPIHLQNSSPKEMPERHKNMLAMVVAQEFPEVIPGIAGTAKAFHPNYNPHMRYQFFLSAENTIRYLNKFENPIEEMRRLLCEEGLFLDPYVIIYFFANTQSVIEPQIEQAFETFRNVIRCLPDDYIYAPKNQPLNLLFNIFGSWRWWSFRPEQKIALANELLKKGFDINYVLTTNNPKIRKHFAYITPNHSAVYDALATGNIDYFEWLVQHGAVIRPIDLEALIRMEGNYNTSQYDMPILIQNFTKALTIMLQHGININERIYNPKQTLLTSLIESNRFNRTSSHDKKEVLIRILQEHGAKTNEELGLRGGRRRATRVKRAKRLTRRRKV